MSSSKQSKPKARLPRGFRDRGAAEIMAEQKMLATIRGVYESYGFEPLETPAFEYTDALGKFLPDVERPNEGVFSLKDDDEQWMSLRYDLTAPLARYVAANFQNLTKPFRRYQTGTVWRNEKPGPGRYREFTQFDADTVGSASASADAELLMMLSDTMEALGLKRGDYIVKLNNRKLLDGVLEASGVALEDRARRGIVLRAIDKIDRLGVEGVSALLGEGRKDESGDFTKGAGLTLVESDAPAVSTRRGVIAVFAGTGGPDAVRQVLSHLPVELSVPVMVAQRLDAGNHDRLVPQLAKVCPLPVVLAEADHAASGGAVAVLPTGMGVEVGRHGDIRFAARGQNSSEVLRQLATFGADLVVVIASGADHDISEALSHCLSEGAVVIGQEPSSCFDCAAADQVKMLGGQIGAVGELTAQAVKRWKS